MRIALTRHGQTDWNAAHRIHGHTDIPLNDAGRAEARAVAEKLAGLEVTLVVASDLARAWESAEIIAAQLKVPLIKDERLRVCRFGTMEGLTRAEAKAIYHSRAHDAPHAWHGSFLEYDFRPWGGETRDVVLANHRGVLDELVPNGDLVFPLLVGHGLGLNTLLAALGHPPTLERGEYVTLAYPA